MSLFFFTNISVHAVAVIVISEFPKQDGLLIVACRLEPYCRMLYAVEHICLYRSVMVHILKGKNIFRFNFVFESPVTDEVSAQAGISTEPVGYSIGSVVWKSLGNDRFIWHLKAIRHVAGE